jgi:hypothetical protein
MEFQKLLKIEFERKGLKTVQQMADFSGINTEYLRQALHGKRILSDDIIVEACDKMKLSTEKNERAASCCSQRSSQRTQNKRCLEPYFQLSSQRHSL